jgi:hypothetical protein
MALRGRHWFFLWLLLACGALWLVIWRQTDSFRIARALNEIRTQRAILEGQRSNLDRRIRSAGSRDELIPRAAARLGLRAARDSEIFRINVPVPSGAAAPPPGP